MEYIDTDRIIPYLSDVLERDEPIFINRLGGSDFSSLLHYLYDSAFNFDADFIHVCEYNGYYDVSKKVDRNNNFIRFLKELDHIYKNNDISLAACQVFRSLNGRTNGNPINDNYDKYFTTLKLNKFYGNYHVVFENIDRFIDLFNSFAKDKKILVISPFTDSINHQIKNNKDCFMSGRKLVDCNYKFLKTHITYYDEKLGFLNTPHNNFFETLEYYKEEIDKIEYDIALLSCGSYAHFLGEYIKNEGGKAIYVGGILQLLWGVMGNRWINLAPYREIYNFSECISPLENISFTSNTNKESLNDYMNTSYDLTIPSDFDWGCYVKLNELKLLDEKTAKNHYILNGRNSGLKYK